MNIATHILTKNNSDTVEHTLKSLLPLDGKIIIGDLGSEDNTVNICRGYGAQVVKLPFQNDFAKLRNQLIDLNGNSWQFYIEPWEVLVQGHETIMQLSEPEIYSVQVLQGDIITKESRLWSKSLKLKFIQPVYETLDVKIPERVLPEVMVYVTTPKEDLTLKASLVDQWLKNSPLAKEPYYYKAFLLLRNKHYKAFTEAAEAYLFQDTTGMSSILMQYYLALIQMYLGDTKSAVRGAVKCITAKPLMAEFWCLLGDLYYKTSNYRKAIYYYENAMILGRKRLQNDGWPIEISKYKKHPSQMIESCRNMLNNVRIIQRKV